MSRSDEALDPALCRALTQALKSPAKRVAFLLPMYADGTTGLPVPVPAAATTPDCFELTDLQMSILRALEGKFVRAARLGDIVGGTRQMYHRPGGIWELREMGLVALGKQGYYRLDAPPPGMTEEDASGPPVEDEDVVTAAWASHDN